MFSSLTRHGKNMSLCLFIYLCQQMKSQTTHPLKTSALLPLAANRFQINLPPQKKLATKSVQQRRLMEIKGDQKETHVRCRGDAPDAQWFRT